MFSACFLVDRCVGQSYLMSGLSSIQPLTTQKTSDVCSGFVGVWQACLRSWLLAVRFSPNEISAAHIQTNTAAQGQVTYTRCAKVDAPKSAPHSMHRFSPRMDLVGSPEPPSRANLRCKVHTQEVWCTSETQSWLFTSHVLQAYAFLFIKSLTETQNHHTSWTITTKTATHSANLTK